MVCDDAEQRCSRGPNEGVMPITSASGEQAPMDEQEMTATARKLAPDALKALARIAKDPKTSPRNRARARRQLVRRLISRTFA